MTEQTTPSVAGVTLRGELGRGSAGTVYLGVDDATGHRVAVKVVEAAADRTRTAATGFGVDDDALVRLYRVGRTGDGRTCLVMEFCPGGSLADQVAARGPFDLGEVVCVLHGVLDGLAALHAADLVHGDLTPSNILFTALGRPLLADLDAVGRVGEPVGERMTEGFTDETSTVLVPADDLYALGAVGWFLLTGEAPGPAASRLPLPALRQDTPAALADLVVACLGPASRRPSVPEAVTRLGELGIPAEPVRLRPVPRVPDRAAVITARTRHPAPVRAMNERVAAAAERARLEETRNRRRRRATVGVAVAVVGGLLGLWGVTRPSAPAAQAAPAPRPAPVAASMPADPVAALAELNRRRVLATTNRDAGALGGVDAPASPALRHDRALIAGLRRADAVPDRLRVSILWATVRSTTATRSEILLSSRVESYRLVRPDGSVLRTVTRGSIVTDVVTLTRVKGEWRVLSVRDS